MNYMDGTKRYSGVQRAVGEPDYGEDPRKLIQRKQKPEPRIGLVLRGKPTLR
jgi:hypothetical protein